MLLRADGGTGPVRRYRQTKEDHQRRQRDDAQAPRQCRELHSPRIVEGFCLEALRRADLHTGRQDRTAQGQDRGGAEARGRHDGDASVEEALPGQPRGAAGNGGPCQRLILMDVPSVSLNPVPGDCGVCIGLRVRDASGNPEGGLQQASDATSSTRNADRNMVNKATAGRLRLRFQ